MISFDICFGDISTPEFASMMVRFGRLMCAFISPLQHPVFLASFYSKRGFCQWSKNNSGGPWITPGGNEDKTIAK
jgi:hypothetical protein